MALRLYLDAACTQEIDELNPDIIHKAVVAGADMLDERSLWIKSDADVLTYENIETTAKLILLDEYNNPVLVEGDPVLEDLPPEISIQYAVDNNGSPGAYLDPGIIPDGPFDQAVRIWRKVIAPSVESAFKFPYKIPGSDPVRKKGIVYKLNWDEYVI